MNAVTLEPVKESQKHILGNLFSLFIHDLAAFEDAQLNASGLFECEQLDEIVNNPHLRPFFIYSKTYLVGFIVVSLPPFSRTDTHVIQQLFVINGFRKKGIGGDASFQILNKFPGKYGVSQALGNKSAISFWQHFYKEHRIVFEEAQESWDGEKVVVQRFVYD